MSAMGVDGWSHSEVAALPQGAWEHFLRICDDNPASLFMSLTAVYRRVPIPKVDSVPSPLQIRPIDVYSVILRVHASAATTIIKPWLATVLHPGQKASRGGVVVACARIAWLTECSLVSIKRLWGELVLTLTKMFNQISPLVAAKCCLLHGIRHWKCPISDGPYCQLCWHLEATGECGPYLL